MNNAFASILFIVFGAFCFASVISGLVFLMQSLHSSSWVGLRQTIVCLGKRDALEHRLSMWWLVCEGGARFDGDKDLKQTIFFFNFDFQEFAFFQEFVYEII